MTNVEYFIYGLVDSRDDKIFYVGMTNNMKNRLIGHLSKANGKPKKWITSHDKNSQYIADMLLEGGLPSIILIDSVITANRKLVRAMEKCYIAYHIANGDILTNTIIDNPLFDKNYYLQRVEYLKGLATLQEKTFTVNFPI